MTDQSRQLRQELTQAGASAAEIEDLLPIASRLSLLRIDKHEATKRTNKVNLWQRIIKPATFMASCLALGMFVVIISQAALPTSMLYPVQKFSDSVAVGVYPQFRANVMMKRAGQVNQLVANHAGSKQILATLADYTGEASAYRSTPHANYAAFEYCKTNLQQAANAATPEVHQAISSSLQSLVNT